MIVGSFQITRKKATEKWKLIWHFPFGAGKWALKIALSVQGLLILFVFCFSFHRVRMFRPSSVGFVDSIPAFSADSVETWRHWAGGRFEFCWRCFFTRQKMPRKPLNKFWVWGFWPQVPVCSCRFLLLEVLYNFSNMHEKVCTKDRNVILLRHKQRTFVQSCFIIDSLLYIMM